MIARRRFLAGFLAAGILAPKAVSAQGAVEPDGFRILRAGPASDSSRAAEAKPTYGGTVPGPLLRVRRGEEVKVRLVNALSEPTSVHWHGVRLRNAMDGVPPLTQPPIAPGASFDYRFAAPDAGTYWYHPHATTSHGLYGMLVVEEIEPLAVDREAVLILDDADGPIVNGAASFDIPIKTNERLRLRLLNAAQTRIFLLRIDRHRPIVMAIDGQPAEPFAARDARVMLAPGNRIDLFVDGVLEVGATAPILVETATDPVTVARLVYGSEPSRSLPRPAPKPLPANPLPERMDFRAAQRLEIPIAGGAPKELLDRPLFAVKRGRTVMLNCANGTGEPQILHLHGHHFRLLDRLDDGWKPFWLDTIPIAPNENIRIAFVADNPGKWLIEAHARTPSLAAWFEVA